MARPNPEYQRGAVWNLGQQKRLIDSVMRGYQLPVIYLHYNKRIVAGLTQESFDIIDGQQRLTALHHFVEGEFPLFTPFDDEARLPHFLQDEPCPWGGKHFHELEENLKCKLLNAELPVAYIETDNKNEVRDLFVRLQSGFPLNAQEKRDSYPGQFTDFILKLGGKPQIVGYPGHPFFRDVLKMKPGSDRGRTRQLAAQIAILFLERRRVGPQYFVDTNSRALDDYYYTHLDFDADSSDCKRFMDILNKLQQLLNPWPGPRLRGHNALHLVLLLDSLWDDYTKSWESNLMAAQFGFSSLLAESAKASKENIPDETWLQYGVWTRSNSDRADNIRRRHRYYSNLLIDLLGGLKPKDPQRSFNSFEREVIYFRDKRTCQLKGCSAEVPWDEAEIHHIIPHSQGGETSLENGALVHEHCHPKSPVAVEAFAAAWKEGHS